MRSFIPLLLLAACSAGGEAAESGAAQANSSGARPFQVRPIAAFDEPWAMAFLPGPGPRALITEKKGKLKLLWSDVGRVGDVAGAPEVDYGGQGGFGDVVLHPRFAENRLVYLSWVEAGPGDNRGAVVGRARFVEDGNRPRLEGLRVIWRQTPKLSGRGHYGHRVAFGPDGKLYVSNGDRQEFTPAQDMSGTLGKIVRLNDDGTVPADNPFASRGGATAQIWSLGHRNPLGIAFDGSGRLWDIEMGPKGGDELNLVERGKNYGYPIVSNGDHYDGKDIPDHPTRPEFEAPKVSWTPVISPGNMIFYSGSAFPAWRGDILVAGLSSKALIRVDVNGAGAREVERWDMGKRIREVEQGPGGSVWLLEDGEGGRLLKLTPAR
ncbi:MAG TPA: PQQ-dependent sugar dehydrogenase [Allosphingosinicella sp.]|nr:PQQ-dependent sugar dehydrogenase [Allosphingosinicella sp.]